MSSSFYKLLVTDDFNSQLRLPPQFVKDHAEILPRKTTLKIESGESWIVWIERIGQHHFFTDGWEKFSRDVNLEFKQFLLFWFDGELGFSVSVYDMSGCQRELIVCSTSGRLEQNGDGVSRHRDFTVKLEIEDEDMKTDEEHFTEIGDEDVKIDEEHDSRAVKKWRFCAELKKRHETELEVPRDFAEGTGIAENRKIFLITHLKSKKWPVFVTARKHKHDQSFAMTVGWNDFLVGREVCIGSTILFEFLSTRDKILIEATVVKNGKKGLYSPKKRRGRPPNFSKFS